MCDPTAIAIGSLALGVGSRVAGAAGKKREANAQRQAAQDAFLGTISDLTARLREERIASALQVEEIGRQEVANVGLARASAGDVNISGVSLDLLLGDIEGQAGRARSGVALQQEFIEAQLGREAEAALAGRESRINQVRGPNFFNEALKIGSLGIDFASNLIRRKPVS